MAHALPAPAVVYSDNHLLVLSKPAHMPLQPDSSHEKSLYDWAKQWLFAEKQKSSGDVFCGIVHRLDREVTGVVVFARTSKAASRLSEQWRARSVEKEYAAVVSPAPPVAHGTLRHYLRKNETTRYVSAFDHEKPDTMLAVTRYKTVAATPTGAMLSVLPETGRPHQIRVQLAAAGAPIVGDKKYGGRPGPQSLALHALAITIRHPTTQETLRFEVPIPVWWYRELAIPAG